MRHGQDRPGRRHGPATRGATGGAAPGWAVVTVAAGLGLGAMAVVNRQRARRAERENPPRGRFVTVDGLRLHYVARGEGPPLVLLHGNGSMIEDFETSGLVDLAARHFKVIVFDRPGYGRSDPPGRFWSPATQADVIRAAMRRVGAPRALVLGHSWGAMVAAALAARHPEAVRGLVLAGGYYFPTPRLDATLLGAPAIPVVGGLLRHTLAPFAGRLIWPRMMARIFGPAPMPPRFRGFPKEMALRPAQLRSSAVESGGMVAAAAAMRGAYAGLRMPVAIVAGAGDRLIDCEAQSVRLHRLIRHSRLHLVPGAGHMVHQSAPDAVMAAVDYIAEAAAGHCPGGQSDMPA